MSAFRELFIEVPQALLEAAVVEAQRRQRPEPVSVARQSEMAGLVRVLPEVFRRRYGWPRAVVSRSAYDVSIRIEGLSHCGHLQCVDIDEKVVRATALTSAIDAIDVYVQTQRGCYCMHPEDR